MSKKEPKYESALSLWKASFQFLSLVEITSQGTLSQGNKCFVIKDLPITEEEFEEETKYSDCNIAIAVLFNLYHGIELLVKGFLLMKGPVKPKHNIRELCMEFKAKYPFERELNEFFTKYTDNADLPTCLKEFFTENEIEFKDLYEALRYPSNPNFERMKTYSSLAYKGGDSLPFFQELHNDIVKVRRVAVKLGRSFEQPKLDNK